MLFHGRGADENDLFPLLDVLDPERRRHGYCPRGPLSLPPGGAHWYAVYAGRLARSGDVRADVREPSRSGSTRCRTRACGSAGFSQGAVMSYALGLGAGRPRPDAIVAFSGFIPQTPAWEARLLAAAAAGRDRPRRLRPGDLGRVRPRRATAARSSGRRAALPRVPARPHARPGFLAEVAGVARQRSGIWFGGANQVPRMFQNSLRLHPQLLRHAATMRPTHAGTFHVTARSIAEEHIFRDARTTTQAFRSSRDLVRAEFLVCHQLLPHADALPPRRDRSRTRCSRRRSVG